MGNRLTENDVTYSYDAANQLVQVGEAIYTYDVNGNLLSDGEKTYQYDHDNRLISLTEGETTTTYTYDGDGNRLSQSIQEGEEARTHEYIYDINKGLPELIVEIEGENEYIYIYAGRVISQIGPDGQAYYHQDGLGSIVLITDEDGEALNRYEYDAFGTPDKLLETIHNPLLFTGEPYDENGLIFLRARYYDPATGRFLTRDTYLGTLDDPLSQHLYVYVANNPVLYVDPSGHLKVCSGTKVQGNTKAYEIIDNLFMGRYFGTTYGEKALDWCAQKIVEKENDAEWYELAPYYAGAGLSALWLEDTWPYTVFVLAGALEVSATFFSDSGYTAQVAARKATSPASTTSKTSGIHMHHTIPKQIQKQLPEPVAKHPDIIGRKGLPNRIPVDASKHLGEVHKGAGGGVYNKMFDDAIHDLGGYKEVTVPQVLKIRDHLVEFFKLK